MIPIFVFKDLTVTAGALWNTTFHGHTSVFQTLEILFGIFGPASFLYLTLGLIEFALQIDVGMSRGQFLLLWRLR